jgi:hypothetical protein
VSSLETTSGNINISRVQTSIRAVIAEIDPITNITPEHDYASAEFLCVIFFFIPLIHGTVHLDDNFCSADLLKAFFWQSRSSHLEVTALCDHQNPASD